MNRKTCYVKSILDQKINWSVVDPVFFFFFFLLHVQREWIKNVESSSPYLRARNSTWKTSTVELE